MIFLKSISDLRSLMDSHKLFSPDPVTIQIPELNPGDAITYESRINCLKKEKGWDLAIKGTLLMMAVLIGIFINIPGYAGAKFFTILPFIIGISVISGCAGKLAGTLWIKVQLKNEIRKMFRRIQSLEKIYNQSWLLD